MPSWLLLLGALSLLLSLNARFPIRRFGALSLVSFVAGWLITELALHHLVAQLVLAALLVAQGALDSRQGLDGFLGLGLLFISWWQLIRLQRRAKLASAALNEALAQLGEWPKAEESPPIRSLDVLLPFTLRPPQVTRTTRQYLQYGNKKLYADIYYNKQRPAGAPVLVFAHGGGWVMGFKRLQALPLLYQLAARGWVCVSLDYRLAPWATFPEPLIDIKQGIAWVKSIAHEFGGDPSFVAIGGNSAGAHLASLAALTPDRPELQPGFEEQDTRVQACLVLYGVFDLLNSHQQWRHRGMENLMRFLVIKQSLDRARAQYELMSPITHVRPDAPPFFIIHGTQDSLVPTLESRHFSRVLRAASQAPVLYAEIPDGQHAFELFKSLRGIYTVRAAVEFLEHIHFNHQAESSPTLEPGSTPSASASPLSKPMNELSAAGIGPTELTQAQAAEALIGYPSSQAPSQTPQEPFPAESSKTVENS